jgi:hypothetical protein
VRGAEGALGRLEGVREVEANTGTRRVRVTPAADRTLDFAAIAPALWREGIRALRVEILAAGTLEPGPRFRISGWPRSFPVDGEAPVGGSAGLVRAEVRVVDGAPRVRLLSR